MAIIFSESLLSVTERNVELDDNFLSRCARYEIFEHTGLGKIEMYFYKKISADGKIGKLFYVDLDGCRWGGFSFNHPTLKKTRVDLANDGYFLVQMSKCL